MRTLLPILLFVLLPTMAGATKDPGKTEIGKVRTELLFATNGSVEKIGASLKKEELDRLKRSSELGGFKNFAKLGSVEQAVLAGYKSWAKPIENSKVIMVTFQPQAIQKNKVLLDVELWQKEKLVLRWENGFQVGKRIYLKGPRWRDGHLIITVELVSLKEKK